MHSFAQLPKPSVVVPALPELCSRRPKAEVAAGLDLSAAGSVASSAFSALPSQRSFASDFFFLSRASAEGDASKMAENARPRNRHHKRAHTGAPQEEAGKSDNCLFSKAFRAGGGGIRRRRYVEDRIRAPGEYFPDLGLGRERLVSRARIADLRSTDRSGMI